MSSGTTCSCIKSRHKEYDRSSRDQKAKAFYTGSEWNHMREKVLQMDERLDVYLYMTRGEIVLADTVHHIIPLRDDWSKRLETGNLMSLSHDTHSMIEQLYKSDKAGTEELLKEMLRLYRKRKRQGGI